MSQLKFTTLDSLLNYKNPRFEEGETVYIQDEEKLYVYHNDAWVPFSAEAANGQFSLTEYELNKMLVSQLNVMSDKDIEYKILELNAYEENNTARHYMLLCRDINYYSVFEPTADFSHTLNTFGEEVIACAQNVGTLISIEQIGRMFEIWVKTDTEETYCMYLFEADEFIVPYRG